MRRLTQLFVIVAAALFVPPAAAENYPTRPIRLYVAFPPGGAADIVARLVAQPLSARLGQPIVVENKPGSGGNIAGELIAHAAPDGYSLLIGPDNLFTINPHLFSKRRSMLQIVPAQPSRQRLCWRSIRRSPRTSLRNRTCRPQRSAIRRWIGNGSLPSRHGDAEEGGGIEFTHIPPTAVATGWRRGAGGRRGRNVRRWIGVPDVQVRPTARSRRVEP